MELRQLHPSKILFIFCYAPFFDKRALEKPPSALCFFQLGRLLVLQQPYPRRDGPIIA